METQVIHQGEHISVCYNTKNHIFCIDVHAYGTATAIVGEDEMVKLTLAIGTKILELNEEIMELKVGDHVKVKGNAPGTAWESGCIEHIEGSMAYILYGVKTLQQWGGIRGMGMPVPLSQLKRID